MKRNALLIIAVLIAILIGLLIGRATGPDPSDGLVLDAASKPGCVKVSVETGSKATFLVVEVVDGDTGPIHFVADKEGKRDTEICVPQPPQAAAMATESSDDEPEIVVFSVKGAKKCKGGFCEQFEDYPQPWPPSK